MNIFIGLLQNRIPATCEDVLDARVCAEMDACDAKHGALSIDSAKAFDSRFDFFVPLVEGAVKAITQVVVAAGYTLSSKGHDAILSFAKTYARKVEPLAIAGEFDLPAPSTDDLENLMGLIMVDSHV